MVKRYQDRKDEDDDDNKNKDETTDSIIHEKVPEGNHANDNEVEEKPCSESMTEYSKQDDNNSGSASASATHSGTDEAGSNDGDRDDEDEVEPEVSHASAQQVVADAELGDSANASEKATGAVPTTDEGSKLDREGSVLKLLDQLNSKLKRTLSRKLDRMGASVLGEVEKEAREMLGLNTSQADDATESGKRGRDKVDGIDTAQNVDSSLSASPPTKNKKRKKEVDHSNLTAEERLRRQEQRRLQEEATERRAKGEAVTKAGHKHPLNSQRRRANRRKPTWKRGSKVVTNDHNSSGFMMRKHSGEAETAPKIDAK